MIAIIAAIDRNNALGFANRLLFRLPDDMKRFKALTTGHTIIMGRKTFESLPKGALPNRRNMVLSRNAGLKPEGVEVYGALDEALAHCSAGEEVFVIGGASVYAQAMPVADRLYMTEVDDTASQADAYFPEVDKDVWTELSRERHEPDGRHAQTFSFVDYVRKR